MFYDHTIRGSREKARLSAPKLFEEEDEEIEAVIRILLAIATLAQSAWIVQTVEAKREISSNLIGERFSVGGCDTDGQSSPSSGLDTHTSLITHPMIE